MTTVRNTSKQAGLLERVASPRTRRHLTRFLKGLRRACILTAAVRRGFALRDHVLVWRSTKIY
jgi:hypothetical protein